MSLSYIIQEVCEKCGYDATDDRELVLRIINRAAKEVYESTDLPGCLREITVLVTNDSVIALPYYVGELRNIRAHYTLQRLTIQEMSSKYAFNPWDNMWNKWRLIKKSPLQNCIENTALPIFVTMDDVDTVDVEITVTGQTTKANRVSEVITLAAGETEAQLSQPFIEISAITKDVTNNNDITFTGADSSGNEITLAIVPNDRLNSIYTLVDISALPYSGDIGTAYRYVDVLYKEPLPTLTTDGDEFLCQGFDDAIACKVCEYFFSAQSDGSPKAMEYYSKCNQLITDRIEHTNGETEKTLTFAPNGYLGLYPPVYGSRRLGLFR